MKKLILASLVTLFIACPTLANNNETRSRGNPVTLYNDTPLDMNYMFVSKSTRGFGVFSIDSGATDIYHSGFGDSHARLYLGACLERGSSGYACLTHISNIIPQIYNAELISKIHIKSLYEIEVTCLDGGSTSCLLN
jgi:hypothetical protein